MTNEILPNSRVKVIIPTLNEVASIGNIVSRLKRIGYNNILVVDGHSKDNTTANARKLGANVIFQNGKGKGDALRQAFQVSCVDSDMIMMSTRVRVPKMVLNG